MWFRISVSKLGYSDFAFSLTALNKEETLNFDIIHVMMKCNDIIDVPKY